MTTYAAKPSQATTKITGRTSQASLTTAALVAGISLLIMVIAAPFAELYAYPKLVIRSMEN